MGKQQSKSLPDSAIRIATYTGLAKYCQAFAAGHLNLLILLGAAGLAKSWSLRQAVGKDVFWIDGNATAFGIYLGAYEHRNQPIVLDDPDALYRDRDGVRLLKALCQTDRSKKLCWLSDSKTLRSRSIPQEFTTTSRVAIIANDWKSVNLDVAALEDRGHLVVFEPPALDVHRQAASWFWDQEIFDFVAAHLHHIATHSLRTYILAWELKEAGLDWKGMVLTRCLSGTTLAVAKLKSDPKYVSEEERVRAFVDAGVGCRATYFNHAKKLEITRTVPQILLKHSQPPEDPKPLEDIAELLRKRFGRLGNG